jgi:peptidoglycan/xylan/chitin deacetylase (PgdA/CDA1 family)
LWARTYPDEVRAFARDPLFELANHSWDHAAFTDDCYGLPSVTSDSQARSEVVRAAKEIERLSGAAPRWFRFPGGCHDEADLDTVASAGEQAIGWDVVSGDAFGTDPQTVADAVIDRAKPGSIVVLHLHGGPNAPATAPALREIIPALQQRGFRFVTLSDLLAEGLSRARAG